MPGQGLRKGALRKGAPFALCLLLPPQAGAALCEANRLDEQVVVGYVYDGDTVRLSDGRKLRLIGVDAPEIGRDKGPDEPFAAQARAALSAWLAESPHLGLRYDRERTDAYGRVLAHAYLANGDNVAARLLVRGLGVSLVVPPNVRGAECRRAAERAAQAGRLGVWSLPSHQPLDAVRLTAQTAGFRRIDGVVSRVGERQGDLWLHVGPRLRVHIPRTARDLFQVGPDQLMGVRLHVQGVVKPGRRSSYMRVQHPTALEIITQ
ncbi:MAG: thermonuclease family protein [Gammaproteobacteria bacterium]|nr:thermonuclease family protein [Gammaproteobacteria bacterium]